MTTPDSDVTVTSLTMRPQYCKSRRKGSAKSSQADVAEHLDAVAADADVDADAILYMRN